MPQNLLALQQPNHSATGSACWVHMRLSRNTGQAWEYTLREHLGQQLRTIS